MEDLLNDYFGQRRNGPVDFYGDFVARYRSRNNINIIVPETAEAWKDLCEQVTAYFDEDRRLWPTVLGNLLQAIYDVESLNRQIGPKWPKFVGAVSSCLHDNGLIPSSQNAVWGVFVSGPDGAILPVSAQIVEKTNHRATPNRKSVVAANFLADPQMREQLQRATECCEILPRNSELSDIGRLLVSNPKRQAYLKKSSRRNFLFLLRLDQKIPPKVAFYIAIISPLFSFLLLRRSMFGLDQLGILGFQLALLIPLLISMVFFIFSISWDQAPDWRDLLRRKRAVKHSQNNHQSHFYFQAFIHHTDGRPFGGASAGLAFFWAFSTAILRARQGYRSPGQRNLQEESKRYALSAAIDQQGKNLIEVGQLQAKADVVIKNKQTNKIDAVLFAAQQRGQIITAWNTSTGEDLPPEKEVWSSGCRWVKSRDDLTFVFCPTVQAFLEFFEPAWHWWWGIGRGFVLGLVLLLFVAFIQFPPSSPTIEIKFAPKQAQPTLQGPLILEVNEGELVTITTNVLSPSSSDFSWPSNWLLGWPLVLSVQSSDKQVCFEDKKLDHPLPELPMDIHSSDVFYCSVENDVEFVQIVVKVSDRLGRADRKIIFFKKTQFQ